MEKLNKFGFYKCYFYAFEGESYTYECVDLLDKRKQWYELNDTKNIQYIGD